MDKSSAVLPGAPARAPVLIIGAHRSGTTATAWALRALGLQIGQHLDSHQEPRGLQRLHEQYLNHHGAAWHEPTPFLEWLRTPEGLLDCTEYLRENVCRNFRSIFGYRRNPRGLWLTARLRRGSAWGWKEPRTTLFGPAWLKLFPDARIIHIVRHPLAVALSIRHRELQFRQAGDPPKEKLGDLDYCLRLATTYIEQGETLAARTSYYQCVRFEEIQAAPQKMLATLADFCGLNVTSAQLDKSAATIRPERPIIGEGFATTLTRDLLSNHPIIAKLGYPSAPPSS